MTTPAIDAQLAAAKAWLWGEDGRRSARLLLRQRRIPLAPAGGLSFYSPDDLAADAFRKFWQRVQRHGPVEEVNLPGYLHTVMRNLVTEALRGRQRWEVQDQDRVEEAPDPLAEVAIEGAPGDELSSVRTAIEAFEAPEWVRAGALALATALGWPDAIPSSYPLPRPAGGASPLEAATWTALWFAGRREGLFPDTSGDAGPALRKARSRAGASIRNLLGEAVASVYADAPTSEMRTA